MNLVGANNHGLKEFIKWFQILQFLNVSMSSNIENSNDAQNILQFLFFLLSFLLINESTYTEAFSLR